MEHSKDRTTGKVESYECIYKKHRKISNKCPNATSQTLRKNKNKLNPKPAGERK
jgi:hypothetical protein